MHEMVPFVVGVDTEDRASDEAVSGLTQDFFENDIPYDIWQTNAEVVSGSFFCAELDSLTCSFITKAETLTSHQFPSSCPECDYGFLSPNDVVVHFSLRLPSHQKSVSENISQTAKHKKKQVRIYRDETLSFYCVCCDSVLENSEAARMHLLEVDRTEDAKEHIERYFNRTTQRPVWQNLKAADFK